MWIASPHFDASYDYKNLLTEEVDISFVFMFILLLTVFCSFELVHFLYADI